jgi:hypothetical protein
MLEQQYELSTQTGQTSEYQGIWCYGEHKLHVFVHYDTSYADQSYAYIERWSGSRWEQVWRPVRSSIKTHFNSYHRPAQRSDFSADIDTLLARAKEIL